MIVYIVNEYCYVQQEYRQVSVDYNLHMAYSMHTHVYSEQAI